MKNFVLLFSVIVLLLCQAFDAFALKCAKCHRDEKSIDRVVAQKGIKSRQELFNLIRNGAMAKIHKSLTDEEISEAANFLRLR